MSSGGSDAATVQGYAGRNLGTLCLQMDLMKVEVMLAIVKVHVTEIMWKMYSPMCIKKFVNGVVVKMHDVNFVVKTDDSVPDASEKNTGTVAYQHSEPRRVKVTCLLAQRFHLRFLCPTPARLDVDMCLFLVMLLGFL